MKITIFLFNIYQTFFPKDAIDKKYRIHVIVWRWTNNKWLAPEALR